jgi:hypothetical protein
MIGLLAATALAIVTQDNASLRAAPSATAAQHAQLAAGDLLEVRGQRLDFVQVYDHRRERAGFVRAAQVRAVSGDAAQAPQLLAVVRFLRDTPGAEALGIAYVAAYLKAAPAQAIGAEPFDAFVFMAERPARRASAPGASKAAVAALDTAAPYGVKFNSLSARDGAITLCYDGEVFRRVLAQAGATAKEQAGATAKEQTRATAREQAGAAAQEQAGAAAQEQTRATAQEQTRAALALTRADCIDPSLPVRERMAHNLWRAQTLDRIDASVSGPAKQRLHARRAAVWSSVAFDRAGRSDAVSAAQDAAQRALAELAAIDRSELGDDDRAAYDDAAVRVGAVRWAAHSDAAPAARLRIAAAPGDQAGQTCVALFDGDGDGDGDGNGNGAALVRRCTYGKPWTASARFAGDGKTAVLAVQPLDAWTELWVFRRQRNGRWTIDALPPATTAGDGGIGYIEFAGFVPGQAKLMVARESIVAGKAQRRFEVLKLDGGYAAERWASEPQRLAAFNRWPDAAWQRQSVSLR